MAARAPVKLMNFLALEDRLAPAIFTVTTGDDGIDNPGTLSIRNAFETINLGNTNNLSATEKTLVSGNVGDNDTIRFAPGVGAIFLNNPLVSLGSVTIDGTGSTSRITLDGQAKNGILNLTNQNLTMRSVTLVNGNAGTDNGGGIITGGNITLDDVVIQNCKAAQGGAIFSNGNVTATNCAIFGNRATVSDGGAINTGGSLKTINIRSSTLSNNTAARFGSAIYSRTENVGLQSSSLTSNSAGAAGAIYVEPLNSTVVVTNSTIANNIANNKTGAAAGIVHNAGPFTGSIVINNSTISGTSPGTGNGILIEQRSTGGVIIQSSIVSELSIAGTFTGTNNAIGDGVGTFTINGAAVPAAMLGLLASTDNGGVSRTMAIAAGSPLIDAGSNGFPLDFDGRGTGFPRVLGKAADIGAFESTFSAPPVTPAPRVGDKQFSVGADNGGSVTLRNADNSIRFTSTPFGAGFTGGVRTASADFTGDGVADLAVASGPGIDGRVLVIDGVTQKTLFDLTPFGAGFTRGVLVSAGDLNGDGVADLVITAEQGGGARMRVFQSDKTTFTQRADFFGLVGGDGVADTGFRGGARSAIVDLNGDGVGDLVFAAGAGGGPRIAVFDGKTLASSGGPKLTGDFFAFNPALRDGAFVAGGDFNADGKHEIVAGGGSGAGPIISVFNGSDLAQSKQVKLSDFFFGDPATRNGVRLAVKDIDNDNRADLVLGSAPGAGTRVAAYSGKNLIPSGPGTAIFEFDAFPGSLSGVFVG